MSNTPQSWEHLRDVLLAPYCHVHTVVLPHSDNGLFPEAPNIFLLPPRSPYYYQLSDDPFGVGHPFHFKSCHHRGTAVLKDDPSDAQTSYDLDVLNSKILHRHPRLTPMATPETWTAPKSFHC